MNPYLEGDLWSSIHSEMNTWMVDQISEQLPAPYVALSERDVVLETILDEPNDVSYKPDIRVDKQAVDIIQSRRAARTSNSVTPTATLPVMKEQEHEIPFIKILRPKDRGLITVIELISPANKRSDGRTQFLKKRNDLRRQGVHFLEIDLIRRGSRTLSQPDLPKSDYLAALHRAEEGSVDVWAFSVKEPIPVLPVPLAVGDADVELYLQPILDRMYKRRRLWMLVDYQKAPPPPVLRWQGFRQNIPPQQ